MAFDSFFEARDVLIGHGDVAWNGQLAPKIEQIVLDVGEKRGQRLRQRLRQQHAERRIELVDGANRMDARRIFRDARPVPQAGGSGISGARDDLGQPMAHGFSRSMDAAEPSEIGRPGQASEIPGSPNSSAFLAPAIEPSRERFVSMVAYAFIGDP